MQPILFDIIKCISIIQEGNELDNFYSYFFAGRCLIYQKWVQPTLEKQYSIYK